MPQFLGILLNSNKILPPMPCSVTIECLNWESLNSFEVNMFRKILPLMNASITWEYLIDVP